MAQNYAAKYESKVQEAFKLGSQTERAINREYDFTGVNTINIYSVGTAPLNDYNMEGASRYGSASELGTSLQTAVLTQDKSFTFTIDKRNNADQMNVLEAGKALRRQIDEVLIPFIDGYRLNKIVEGAGTVVTGTITEKNAYTSFLDATVAMLDKKVPLAGAYAYVGSNFYKQIRLDSAFIKPSDMAQEMLTKGVVGMVEGIPIVHIPSSYLPAGVEFIITNSQATVGAEKLAEYKTHDNPPGINGTLVEGRIYFDAFVLEKKKDMIFVQKKTATR